MRQVEADRLQCRVLGGGSNILARDGMLDCVVVEIQNSNIAVRESDTDSVLVTAGASVSWDNLVAFAVDHALWGIENLSAIPGMVGAAPVQNIGAYGTEFDSVCVSVRAYDRRINRIMTLVADELGFQYRSSIFKTDPLRYVIWDVTIRLSKQPRWQLSYKDLALYFQDEQHPRLTEIRSGVMTIREGKFPNTKLVGTAGSFFKNPVLTRKAYEKLLTLYPQLPLYKTADDECVKIPLAYILEKMGYKGHREASVGMHDTHALVLVTYDGARSDAVDLFAKKIELDVQEQTGIAIEREVQFFP
jgi:UDP-N-acetylmuramate dehydrogenase